MKEMVPTFTQIAAVSQSLSGCLVVALDKQGRVWIRSAHTDGSGTEWTMLR